MLRGKSTVSKHTKAQTLYVTIPASMAGDSQFPFKKGDKVILNVNTQMKVLEIFKEGRTHG